MKVTKDQLDPIMAALSAAAEAELLGEDPMPELRQALVLIVGLLLQAML